MKNGTQTEQYQNTTGTFLTPTVLLCMTRTHTLLVRRIHSRSDASANARGVRHWEPSRRSMHGEFTNVQSIAALALPLLCIRRRTQCRSVLQVTGCLLQRYSYFMHEYQGRACFSVVHVAPCVYTRLALVYGFGSSTGTRSLGNTNAFLRYAFASRLSGVCSTFAPLFTGVRYVCEMQTCS